MKHLLCIAYLKVVDTRHGSREVPGVGVVSVADVGHRAIENQSAVGHSVDRVGAVVGVESHVLLQGS